MPISGAHRSVIVPITGPHHAVMLNEVKHLGLKLPPFQAAKILRPLRMTPGLGRRTEESGS
jgi:hypothetical protein